jgi:perosamine synthetase
MADRIPLAVPDLSGNEAAYVSEAIASTWISSSGEFLSRFERDFAEYCGAESALAVANGTVALHVALLALGCGPGDEVIVPSLTYIASVNAIRYTGATPVFADADEQSWCIDPDHVEQLISPRTVGIVAVHLYGQPADMVALNGLAARHGLWVVEDAAEAPGATVEGRPVGGLSDAATFSFYGNKIFTSGEGGAVTVRDAEVARRARLLRGQGMDPERRYYFPIVGYNYRLTNVAAALLCAQLERREQIMARRWSIFDQYSRGLADVDGITLQGTSPGSTRAPWLYSILVDPEGRTNREGIEQQLDRNGIETRPFFIPVHRMPPYADESQEPLPVTDRLGASGINLPTSSVMTADQVDRVIEAVRMALVA